MARWIDESIADDDGNNSRRRCSELMRLMLQQEFYNKSSTTRVLQQEFYNKSSTTRVLQQELFVFVTAEGVDGNNNASERQLRGDARTRKTGRTSKTPSGAKRQSVISSVLQSIGKQLGTLTLGGVIDDIHTWVEHGKSRFQEMMPASGLSPPTRKASLLDRLILNADT